MSLLRRVRAAWRAFHGAPDTERSEALRTTPGAMSTAVALTTECSRADGGDIRVLNGLLGELSRQDLADTAAAAAILAATIGWEWSVVEPDGPAEVLAHIGLAATRKGTP